MKLRYYPLAEAVLRMPPLPTDHRQRIQFAYQGTLVRFTVQRTERTASDIALPVRMHQEHVVHLRLYRDGHLDRTSYCEEIATGAEYSLHDGACSCDAVREFGACEHIYADIQARHICLAWIWHEAKRRQRAQREQRYWTMPTPTQGEIWI